MGNYGGRKPHLLRLQRNDPTPHGYTLASVEEIMSGDPVNCKPVMWTWDIVRLRDGWMERSLENDNPVPVPGFRPHILHKLAVERRIGRLSERIREGIGERGSWLREFLYDCEEGCVEEEEFRQVLQLLLQQQQQINILLPLIDAESGWTVLHSAAVGNVVAFTRDTLLPQLQTSNLLADIVNAKTKQGVAIDFAHGPRTMTELTPLHVAAIYGEKDVVRLLLDHGADPNNLDGSGMAPFTLGLQHLHQYADHLALLLARMDIYNVDILKSQFKDALTDMVVKKNDRRGVVSLLPFFRRKDRINMHGLMRDAMKCNNKEILKTLLNSLPRLGRSGRTALSCLTDSKGLTLLHYAVKLTWNKQGEVVESVIKSCIEPLLEYANDYGQVGEGNREVHDLFWKGIDNKPSRIAYQYCRQEAVQKALVHGWLCKCEAFFMGANADDPRPQTSLQLAARLRMRRLCLQLLHGTADLVVLQRGKETTERRDVEEEMLGKQLERQEWKATLSEAEMVNVMEVLQSHRLGMISQDKDELEQHVTQASDQPTSNDILGRKPLVDALAALILNPYVSAPLTIGIYGDWGIGKSSLMLQMEIRLLQIVIEQTISKSDSMQVHCGNFFKTILQSHNSSLVLLLQEKVFRQFISNYNKRHHSLFKSLALLDILKLVEHNGATTQQRHTPSILTVRYNAWQYQDEKEALAGLANEISKEIETAMTTSQWLSMCWCNSMSDRHHGRPPIFLTCSILLTSTFAILICWLVWVLLSSSTNSSLVTLKYGSVPLALITIFWSVFQQIYRLIVPVSKSLKEMFSPINHEENLGYHQQVIDDIRFLLEELHRTPSMIWQLFAWIWTRVLREQDRDYVVIRPEATIVTLKGSRLLQLSSRIPWFDRGNIHIRKEIPSKNIRVVVFVDDLDRCNEETILQVLSSINLVLSVCEFNVVMGVEKSMILRAIKKKLFYEEDPLEASHLAERFLEKIVQLPVVLPDPGRKKVGDFLTGQMGFWLREPIKPRAPPSNPNMIGIRVLDVNDPDSDELEEDELHNLEDDGLASDPLFATYTAHECVVFVDLQNKYTTDELRHPREWKRLLNYHRLACNVVSQSKDAQVLQDWKTQLIVWVFVCWNWKELMDEIIQDWDDICKQFENGQPSLKEIVELKVNTERASTYTIPIKKWKRMLNMLQKYDISMKGIQMFQDFRFQCRQVYLQWPTELHE